MEEIILSLYSSLLTATLLLASPTLLFKPKTRAGLKEKMGLLSEDLLGKLSECDQTIWIHAVSVGEFNGAFPLIEAIKAKFPSYSLVVSTTTKAGHAMAEKRAGKIAQIIYFPFDLPWVIKKMLDLVNPTLVIIFETELWPNFISFCQRRHVPVVLLNARMSPRSFKGYSAIKVLFAPLLKKLTLIGAQTEVEAQNYKFLVGTTVPITVVGNSKYDWPADMTGEKRAQLKKELGIAENDLVVVAGSTHADEEKVILDLRKRYKRLKIIIAPRHPERFEEVAKTIENADCRVICYSQSGHFVHEDDIYLLDTMGQLANYYSLASVAFVGGSLAKVGGHNLLEPYLYGVPVVCGPHLDKTRETAAILSKQKALFIGNNAQEVEDKLITLIENESLRKQMGKIGQTWLNNNRGAVEASMTAITDILLFTPKRSAIAGSGDNLSNQSPAHAINPWHKLKESNKKRRPRNNFMSWGNPQTTSDHLRQAVLTPLAWPYKLVLDLRQTAYDQKWFSAGKLSCPVVSVGNLTVGGTGKTPVIVDLAARLLADKIKVGILSRGYARRENSDCVVVGNGQGVFGSLSESGDEALMMAKALPQAVVIVDRDRVAAGEKAISEYECQILLLDDGFQHWRLQRDSNIVLIDYADDPRRDALLPAGRLREPLSALARATHIIITKVPEEYSREKLDYLKDLARSFAPQAKISSCRFFNSSVEQFISGGWQSTTIDLLNKLPVVAFCGIAKPDGFFETVKRTGARVAEEVSFPDHHHYSQADLEKLERTLKQADAKYLVTTRKDLIKLDFSPFAPLILAINQNVQWIEAPPDIMSLQYNQIYAPKAVS